MKSIANVTVILTLIALLPAVAGAQMKSDSYGKAQDTVFAEITKIDDNTRSITISCFNDENIVAVAVPLHLSAGMTRVIADSVAFTGGRVADWDYRKYRVDTTVQCVLIAGIATLSAQQRALAPGAGRLATVFVSSADGKPIEELTVDTTTMAPDHSLMMVVDRFGGSSDKTDMLEFVDRQFVPVWVVRESEK